jgi:predicted amidohydrolase
VERADALLAAELARTGAGLVVLPEGWPVSFLAGRGNRSTAGVAVDGPELAAVAALAARHGVYLAASVLERPAAGGDAPMRTAYLFDERGAPLLRRHGLVGGGGGYEPRPRPAPWDGNETPVIPTRFGNVAVVAGREVLSLELIRLLAYRGVEIVLHPTAEHSGSLAEALRHARRVRAAENCCYLATAGQGELLGPVPSGASRAGSCVVDYQGAELATLAEGRTAGVEARLDVAALRARRASGAMNKLIQLRPQIYVPGYRRLRDLQPAAAVCGGRS